MPRVLRPCPAVDGPDDADDVALARQIAARHDRICVARRDGGKVTNTYEEQPWNGRTLPKLPYFVYLARDSSYYRLAFDLDAAGGDVEADAALLRQMLTDAGIRFIEAISGPGGGHHLIAARDPLPAVQVAVLARHLARGHLRTLDPSPLCNATTGGIRPPGSPHRHGGSSVLLTPPTVAAAALDEGDGRTAFDRLYALVVPGHQVGARRLIGGSPPSASWRRRVL